MTLLDPSVTTGHSAKRLSPADAVPTWVSLAIAVVVVLVEAAVYFLHIRHQTGAFGDLMGRVTNFEDLKSSGNIYTNFAIEGFTYPPGGILLLCPIVLVPTAYIGAAWTVGVLGSLLVTFYFVGRSILSLGESAALLLACALTIASPILWSSVYDVIFWGQVGAGLMLLVVADFLVVRGSTQGVLVGLATTLKIYPGVFIIIWLVRRQYRQALVALATVAVTTLAAFAFWYDSSVSFLHDELVGNQELAHFSTYTTAQSSSGVDDIFFRPPYFLGHLSATNAMVVAVLVGLIGLIAAFGAWRRGHELTALTLTLVVSTISSPIAWNHYFVFLPLLLFLPKELGWRSWTTYCAYFALAVNIVPWHRYQLAGAIQILMPAGQRHLSWVAQNATLVSMLLLLAAATVEFWPWRTLARTRRNAVDEVATRTASN